MSIMEEKTTRRYKNARRKYKNKKWKNRKWKILEGTYKKKIKELMGAHGFRRPQRKEKENLFQALIGYITFSIRLLNTV